MKRLLGVLLACMWLPASVAAQADFDILKGQPRASIAFQYANNFILVEVRLFGLLPMSFIFDTGAEHTILFKKEFADIFKTQYDLRVPIIGSDLSREIYALVARSVDIEVIGLDPVQRDILVLEEDYLTLDEITGRPIHGILGSSFFKNVVVQLDFRKQRLILHSPESFHPPSGAFHEYEITVRSGKPYLKSIVSLAGNTKLDVILLIDTGAGLPLLLHNNTDPRLVLPEHYIRGKLGLGLGGFVEGHLGRIEALNLGVLTFPHILTSFQDLSHSVMQDSTRFRNGLIGTQLLTRFQVYIDYVNEKMYLRTQGNYNKKFKMDKSGLIIFAMGQNLNIYVVQDILANSPAADADIRQGDIIKKVQGLPASMYALDNLLHIFQRREGKSITLVIQRKQETLKKRFKLKELI
ncbi:MAG TPA: aspartyl protease family protein [Saprospiraceae bacterium]|nr:aspartyl protease family protein [Saprospiraceae bacterium]